MFIPFMGAYDHDEGDAATTPWRRRGSLAGPIVGALGAPSSARSASRTTRTYLKALAFLGFFLNLFNLLPVVPLDGGRISCRAPPRRSGSSASSR